MDMNGGLNSSDVNNNLKVSGMRQREERMKGGLNCRVKESLIASSMSNNIEKKAPSGMKAREEDYLYVGGSNGLPNIGNMGRGSVDGQIHTCNTQYIYNGAYNTVNSVRNDDEERGLPSMRREEFMEREGVWDMRRSRLGKNKSTKCMPTASAATAMATSTKSCLKSPRRQVHSLMETINGENMEYISEEQLPLYPEEREGDGSFTAPAFMRTADASYSLIPTAQHLPYCNPPNQHTTLTQNYYTTTHRGENTNNFPHLEKESKTESDSSRSVIRNIPTKNRGIGDERERGSRGEEGETEGMIVVKETETPYPPDNPQAPNDDEGAREHVNREEVYVFKRRRSQHSSPHSPSPSNKGKKNKGRASQALSPKRESGTGSNSPNIRERRWLGDSRKGCQPADSRKGSPPLSAKKEIWGKEKFLRTTNYSSPHHSSNTPSKQHSKPFSMDNIYTATPSIETQVHSEHIDIIQPSDTPPIAKSLVIRDGEEYGDSMKLRNIKNLKNSNYDIRTPNSRVINSNQLLVSHKYNSPPQKKKGKSLLQGLPHVSNQMPRTTRSSIPPTGPNLNLNGGRTGTHINNRKLSNLKEKPYTTSKMGNSKRIYFNKLPARHALPILIINFDGVIGDIYSPSIWKENSANFYLRSSTNIIYIYIYIESVSSLRFLRDFFQIVLITRWNRKRTEVFREHLFREGVEVDGMYQNVNRKTNYYRDYTQTLLDFDVRSHVQVLSRVIVLGSLDLSLEEIQSRGGEAENLLHEKEMKDETAGYYSTGVPLNYTLSKHILNQESKEKVKLRMPLTLLVPHFRCQRRSLGVSMMSVAKLLVLVLLGIRNINLNTQVCEQYMKDESLKITQAQISEEGGGGKIVDILRTTNIHVSTIKDSKTIPTSPKLTLENAYKRLEKLKLGCVTCLKTNFIYDQVKKYKEKKQMLKEHFMSVLDSRHNKQLNTLQHVDSRKQFDISMEGKTTFTVANLISKNIQNFLKFAEKTTIEGVSENTPAEAIANYFSEEELDSILLPNTQYKNYIVIMNCKNLDLFIQDVVHNESLGYRETLRGYRR